MRKFAELQLKTILPLEVEIDDGIILGHRNIPVTSVGSYIPGGRYPMSGSAQMSIIPAKVAGVKNVYAFTPPVKNMGFYPATINAMKKAGADRIFAEKVSGAKTDRKQLTRAIEALRKGDVLLITRLDRLARSTRELLNVLAAAWMFTRTSEGRRRAQERGVRFGRKPKLTTHQIAEALTRRQAGEALTEIGRSYNVSHSTISRL